MRSVVFVLAALVVCVSSHMSIFTPSVWGSEPDNINSNLLAHPLEDLDFNDWWWHGQDADGPINNAITTLPAGGTHDFEITGNKAFTSMGRGLCKADPNGTPRDPPNPWDNGWNGQCSANVHAPRRDEVAGCALAVAYKSSKAETKPADFVVFSVVHDCVARPLQVFDIPAMPACPNGKCMCAWFWIHNSVGGTDQMYMTAFQCNFSSPSTRKIGTPQPPVRCDGNPSCWLYPAWGNKTTTCRNPLQPMYWANNQGNNMANPTNSQCAPVYNASYGFPDGAQNNIFVGMEVLEGDFGDTIVSNQDINYISSDEGTRVVSPHRHSQVAVSQDGNIIFSEVQSQKVLWASKTSNLNGVAPYRLIMQHDGNLVLRDSQFNLFWASNTAGQGTAPYKLKVRDFNSLTVVDANGYTIFSAL